LSENGPLLLLDLSSCCREVYLQIFKKVLCLPQALFPVLMGIRGFRAQVVGRVIEDINRSIHSAASSTTLLITRNKASTGLISSNEVPDLEAEERAQRAEENWSLIRGYE